MTDILMMTAVMSRQGMLSKKNNTNNALGLWTLISFTVYLLDSSVACTLVQFAILQVITQSFLRLVGLDSLVITHGR